MAPSLWISKVDLFKGGEVTLERKLIYLYILEFD